MASQTLMFICHLSSIIARIISCNIVLCLDFYGTGKTQRKALGTKISLSLSANFLRLSVNRQKKKKMKNLTKGSRSHYRNYVESKRFVALNLKNISP